jgi:hypothetical protein
VILSELAAREAELSARVDHATGTMEEKEAVLAAEGVFDAYADVLSTYCGLFDRPGDGAEALARAAFLIWYEVAEPAVFSGLRDLPETLVEATLKELNTVAAHSSASRELVAMLGYYHAITDFAFTRGGPWPDLAKLLASADPHAWRADVLPPPDRWARGQLSEYWASILKVT